jgi:hypothetical protein
MGDTDSPELAPIASESTLLRQQSSRLKGRAWISSWQHKFVAWRCSRIEKLSVASGDICSQDEIQFYPNQSAGLQYSNAAELRSASNRNIATIQRTPVKASGANPSSRNVTATAGAPIRPVVRSRAPQFATACHFDAKSSRQNVFKGSPRTQTSHVRELTGPVGGRPHGSHIVQHKRHTNHIHPVAQVNQARHLHHPHKTQHLHQPSHPYHARPKHCRVAETPQNVLHRETRSHQGALRRPC